MKSNMEGDDLVSFARLLNSRISAESRVRTAVAFGWLCAGIAIAACLVSIGLTFAMLGYSYLTSIQPSAEIAAKALSDALSRANIKTAVTGTMELANSEITLSAGQSIRLAEPSVVRLDPNSSIRVATELRNEVPQPTKRQLQLDATASSKETPFTRYTVFKSTGFNSGVVVTGWSFELTDTSRPQSQRCYYEQTLDKGLAATQTIAIDGVARRPSALTKLSFDFDGALGNCIWFSGL